MEVHEETKCSEIDERYRALLNAIDEGFCIVEIIFDANRQPQDYRFLEINPAFERQTGLKNAQGRRMRELAPLHEEHWFQIYGEVARTGRAVRFVNVAKALNRWFEVYAFRFSDLAKAQVGILFNDITARRRAEEALSEREEQLRLIFESATEYAIVASDDNRRITAWNSGAERLLGYAEEEIVGQSGDILFTAEDQAAHAPETEARTAFASGQAANERWHVRKDGTRFWGSGLMFPLLGGDRKPRGLLKIFRDRTAQQQVEEHLRESEERLRIAIETAQLGTWSYDPATGKVDTDERTRELCGISPNVDPTYDDYLNAFHSDDRAQVGEQFQKILTGGSEDVFSFEYRLTDTGVRKRWIRVGGRAHFDEAHHVLDCVGTVLDISDLVEARELLTRRSVELEQTVAERTAQLRESVQQLETVSYSVVHDMRAPLRSVRSFADILDMDYGPQLDATARHYLNRMKAAVSRMDELITDVLAYSRVTAIDAVVEAVDLDILVREIVEQYPQFQEEFKHVQIQSPLFQVMGSRALLTQCVSNLLGNALKFVAIGRAPQVVIRAEKRADKVRLWFEDNGIGIPPKQQLRIFGLFERLHREEDYPGTGVGLAIVQRAVERMRGAVGVESLPDRGSRFWIELPAAPSERRG